MQGRKLIRITLVAAISTTAAFTSWIGVDGSGKSHLSEESYREAFVREYVEKRVERFLQSERVQEFIENGRPFGPDCTTEQIVVDISQIDADDAQDALEEAQAALEACENGSAAGCDDCGS